MFSYKTTRCHFQNKPFSTLFKINQNMPILPFSKSIKMYQNQHQAILNSHIDTLPKFPKPPSNHFNTSQSNGYRANTISYHTSFLIPISDNTISKLNIIIHNHHHTHHQHGTTHQFNLNHSSCIYHNMHFSYITQSRHQYS